MFSDLISVYHQYFFWVRVCGILLSISFDVLISFCSEEKYSDKAYVVE